MVRNISWGTYLFFAAVSACFFPVIWLSYPETAGRSPEEIDLIFAKGYLDHMSYVRATKELPLLSDQEIERVAVQYGFAPPDNGGRGNSSGSTSHNADLKPTHEDREYSEK
jgi:hypothetical protein